jgi:hypothetical protein
MTRKTKRSKPRARRNADPNKYPKGLNRKKVEALVEHYEKQTDDDAIAEAEAAYRNLKTTMMPVPVELVPAVEKLIARRRAG